MMVKPGVLVLGMMAALSSTVPAAAQVVVTPIVSANVNTSPGFIDIDDAASKSHVGAGVVVSRVTDGWFGVEGEVTLTPSAFSGGDLVESSRLLAATGSVLFVAPARWGLRPYLSIGAGLIQIKSIDVGNIFAVDASRGAMTAAAGAWMWVTPRIGIRTNVRLLRSIGSVDFDSFETWQPSIGVAIKF